MRVLIGADIVPTKSNIELFIHGDAEALVGHEIMTILKEADYRIFNLEVPLTDHETPINKCGEALIAPVDSVNGLKAMNIDLVTLSNNHIMDQDVQGLDSTIHVLDGAQIAHVGAGFTPEEAAQPYVFCCDGKTIGIYACAEHEFSIVTAETPGANPIDLLESFDHILQLKHVCDYVIVLYHGGKEHYRYPSPNLQKVCRKMVDKGADIVICQHSHCIGAEEKYKNSTIVYGQGNFLFDGSDSEYWQTGLLIQICDNLSIDYIPIVKEGNKVRLADKTEADFIKKDFMVRNSEIIKPQMVIKKYNEFAQYYFSYFLSVASGRKFGFVFRAFNKVSGGKLIPFILRRRYKKKKLLALYNHITCEANLELFSTGLKKEFGVEYE